MVNEVSGAPYRRPPYASADPQMAQGGSIGGRAVVQDEGRDAPGVGNLAPIGEYLSSLRSGSVGRQVGERRCVAT